LSADDATKVQPDESPIRVLLVDDHAVVRKGCEHCWTANPAPG